METLAQIKLLNYIKDAYVIYGNYDIIAQIEIENEIEVKRKVVPEFRKIAGIRNTMTLIGLAD